MPPPSGPTGQAPLRSLPGGVPRTAAVRWPRARFENAPRPVPEDEPCEVSTCVQCRTRFGERHAALYLAVLGRYEQEKRDELLAQVRARETLLSILTPENRDRLDRGSYVTVCGSNGGEYRVEFGYSGNIVHTWTDSPHGPRRQQRLCAHPRMSTADGTLPIDNAMISQILMITTDEDSFLEIANEY